MKKLLLLLGFFINFGLLRAMEEQPLKHPQELEEFHQKKAPTLKEIAAKVVVIRQFLTSSDLKQTEKTLQRLPQYLPDYIIDLVKDRSNGRTLLHEQTAAHAVKQLIGPLHAHPRTLSLEKETPLISLIKNGNLEAALALLEIGGDQLKIKKPDIYGNTTLSLAKLFGNSILQNMLIIQGASNEDLVQLKLAQYNSHVQEDQSTSKNQARELLMDFLQLRSITDGVNFLSTLPDDIQPKHLLIEAQKHDPMTGLTLLHTLKEPITVQLLLLLDADFSIVSKEGQTPLHYMIKKGNFRAALTLLNRGVYLDYEKTDNYGMTPLCYAALYKHPQLTRELLKKGASPFYLVTSTATHQMPLSFAFHGLNYGYRSVNLQKFMKVLYTPEIIQSLSNNQKIELLAFALKTKQEHAITTLLGNDTFDTLKDSNGLTTAMFLAKYNKSDSLKNLLERNDVNLEITDPQSETALFHALHKNSTTFTLLLKAGARVNITAQGKTPLQKAKDECHAAINPIKKALRKQEHKA